MYRIGHENRDIPAGTYATLAEAASAIQRAKGWTEVHLSECFLAFEVSIPTYAAYPTAEEREADDYANAPWIYDF